MRVAQIGRGATSRLHAVGREWSAARRSTRVLVLLQIAVILAGGVLIAYKFPPWSPIDEGAHYDYVQTIAEDGRLPVLGRDQIHPEVAAIGAHTYPNRAPRPYGLAGESYEAFQPPLYYALMVPVWKLTPDYSQKMKLIRGMGLLFAVLTVAVLAWIARMVRGPDWPGALAFALLVFVVPGMLIRFALVGNGALEPLLAVLLVACVVRAWLRVSYRWVLAGSVVLGLCLLNRLVAGYLIPVFAAAAIVVWWRRGRKPVQLAYLAVAGVVPVLMLAPWFAFNRDKYGAWTASSIAREMQIGIVNPTGRTFGVLDVLHDLPVLSDFAIPSEWNFYVMDRPWAHFVFATVQYLVIPIGALLIVVFGRRALTSRALWWCIAPLPLAWIALAASTELSDWPQMLARYTAGALPVFALAVYGAYRVAIPRDRDWSVFVSMVVGACVVTMVVMLWIGYVDNRFVPS